MSPPLQQVAQSITRHQESNQQIVEEAHWRVDSALVQRHDRLTQGDESEHPVPDRYPTWQARPKEGTVAPDRRTPEGPRAAHTKSISQLPANDEQERAQ